MNTNFIKNRLKTLETNAPAYVKKRQVEQQTARGPGENELRWAVASLPDNFLPAFFLDGHYEAGSIYELYDGTQWRGISHDEFVQQDSANREGSVKWGLRYSDCNEASADYVKFIKEPVCTVRSYTDYPPEKIKFEQFISGQWLEISEEQYKSISK